LTKIGLISDTHHYLDPNIFNHFKNCDEIWHAGDIGSYQWIENWKAGMQSVGGSPIFRAVYGNIDGYDIRSIYPERLWFNCEEVKVMIQHIGGYPNKYAPAVKDFIKKNKTQLFISGQSHILKIIYDPTLECLHMNPGAAGKQGWQKVRTIVRFTIDKKDIKDCEVIELD
jgi:putative phosphoesterase